MKSIPFTFVFFFAIFAYSKGMGHLELTRLARASEASEYLFITHSIEQVTSKLRFYIGTATSYIFCTGKMGDLWTICGNGIGWVLKQSEEYGTIICIRLSPRSW